MDKNSWANASEEGHVPPVDAVFIGWQPTVSGEEIPLYNVVRKPHPAYGSTVSEETLLKLCLAIPHTPVPRKVLW